MAVDQSQIQHALHQFYSSADPEERQRAHRYLLSVQEDANCWQTMVGLLLTAGDSAVHFYAANALSEVLRIRWSSEKMDHNLLTIRDSLLHACVHRKPVNTTDGRLPIGHMKVLQSLALCLLRSVPDVWPNAVEESIRIFSAARGQRDLCFLLATVPEEFIRFGCQPEHRIQIRNYLRRAEDPVAQFLTSVQDFDNPPLMEQVLRCSGEWLALSIDLPTWEPVVRMALACYSKPPLLPALAQCFGVLVDHACVRNCDAMLELLFQFAIQLRVTYMTGPQLDFLNSQSPAWISANMVCSLAENQSEFILEKVNDISCVEDVVETVLLITQSPGTYPLDERISMKAHEFWYTLATDVNQTSGCLTKKWYQTVQAWFRRLFTVVMCKIRYDERLLPGARVDSEDWEQFCLYRSISEDTLRICYTMLDRTPGGEAVALLHTLLSDQATAANQWIDVEAILFFFCSIGDVVKVEQAKNTEVRLLQQLLPNLPRNHYVLNTAYKMVRKLNHVIEEYSLYEQVLGVVIDGLSARETLREAADTVVELMKPEKVCLARFTDRLEAALSEWMESGDLSRTTHLCLVTCYGRALSARKGPNALTGMQKAMEPILQRMNAICSGQLAATKVDVLFQLDCLATFLQALTLPTGIPYDLISPVCELLKPLYNASGSDADIARRLTDLMITLLIMMRCKAECLIPMSSQVVPAFFPPHPYIMQYVTQMFKALPRSDETSEVVTSLFNYVTEQTNRTLAMLSMEDQLDLLENYLTLALSACQKCPHLWDNAALMNLPVNIAVASMNFAETSVTRLSTRFLNICLTKGEERPAVQGLVRRYAEAMASQCWQRLTVEPLMYCVDYLCDVLYPLYKHFGASLGDILPKPPVDDRCVSSMMKNLGNKRLFVEAAKAYNVTRRLSRRV